MNNDSTAGGNILNIIYSTEIIVFMARQVYSQARARENKPAEARNNSQP